MTTDSASNTYYTGLAKYARTQLNNLKPFLKL
jgi:hypothetical protein